MEYDLDNISELRRTMENNGLAHSRHLAGPPCYSLEHLSGAASAIFPTYQQEIL